MAESIPFNIQLSRVLDVLCDQIYDSPMALLRENVQNAYDAILMRKVKEDHPYIPAVYVNITSDTITIEDNGIGMNAESLKKNFWTAGSSGKNNDEAKSAGVVGTFGIGAMANFGVCKSLRVITHAIGTDTTYTSYVDKASLSLDHDCITIEKNVDTLPDYGTRIIATLDNEHQISPQRANEYLSPYVSYLPIPVYLNGKLISMTPLSLSGSKKVEGHYRDDRIEFDYVVAYNDKSAFLSPQIEITNIFKSGRKVDGCVLLKQSDGVLYGLRNFFGLAPIPNSSIFNFGGIVNLPTLVPTAGREAVSRSSIEQVAEYLRLADQITAEKIAEDEIAADNSRELLNYIRTKGAYSLAGNICISSTEKIRYKLKDCHDEIDGRKLYYYEGNDNATIQRFSSQSNIILQPANDHIRRLVQMAVLKINQVQVIPDTVSVTKTDFAELTVPQISIQSRVRLILQEDYFLQDVDVCYGEITHQVDILVQREEGKLVIYLHKDSSDVQYLSRLYETDYGYFEPMVKDFVRTKLYTKISQYVPSSVRGGADALYNLLQKNKELFTIESNELGEVESVMQDYLNGTVEFTEVLKASKILKNKQTISVGSAQIGDISSELANHVDGANPITDMTKKRVANHPEELFPQPPIMRQDIKVDYKVLMDKTSISTINGYDTFLALSDKMFKQYNDFFLFPHMTRVIWSMHKIIYIFTHESGNITLYYDIDLEKPLKKHSTGGSEILTSTIITKNKIFVPVIKEISDYFHITSGQLRFSVKFDTVNR